MNTAVAAWKMERDAEGIDVTDFRVPDVRFSDHRPLVCDFHVRAGAVRRSAA